MTVKSAGSAMMALLVGMLLLAGCEDDAIPTFAPPPYLFSNISITKECNPVPGSALRPGSTVNLRFSVAYTLDPNDFQNRAGLGMFINLFGRTPTDSLVSIGGFPDKILQLSEQGGVLRDSLQFTLPPGIARLTMEAFLDSLPFANPVISIDSQIWPVQ